MKKIVSALFTVMVLTYAAISQVTVCDSLFFEAGKSKISSTSTKILLKIPQKVKMMALYDITLTAYMEKSSGQKSKQSLVMNRFQEICKFLIKQDMGSHIRDIEIVTVGGTEQNAILIGHVRNRIDVTIEEKFPDPEKIEQIPDETTALASEPDTVITSAQGTRIKIQGGSFFPLKISDYHFEIKELLTTDDFIDNNVSTTTTDNFIIANARAIRILAIPKNPSSPVPGKLQKPAIIMIPYTDSLKSGPLTVFYQARNNKSFITWKKTNDTAMHKQYGGNNFYMINVTQLGWVMIGGLLTSCNCRIITPRFQEQKMRIGYPDLGSVVFLDNSRENMFNIPCGEGDRGFKTIIQASDQSGQIFSLERTFWAPETAKDNIGVYKIRKRDYVKL